MDYQLQDELNFILPYVDCSLLDCSVHGISQARILEWVAISFSRGSYHPRDQTGVSCIAGELPSRLEGLWYCGQGDGLLSPQIGALIPPPSLTGGITGKFRDFSVPQSYHL